MNEKNLMEFSKYKQKCLDISSIANQPTSHQTLNGRVWLNAVENWSFIWTRWSFEDTKTLI